MSYPPEQAGPFTIAFPEEFDVGGEPASQMIFTFNRTAEREYGDMVVARYEAMMVPDPGPGLNFCFVANADTGYKDRMTDLLCEAYARRHVTMLYNTAEGKSFPGVSRPLSQALLVSMDGSVRPRGMCGAVRMVGIGHYLTVDLVLPAYWNDEPDPS